MTMIMTATAIVFAALYGDTPDAKHAWAVHDINRPKPAKVEVEKSMRFSDSSAANARLSQPRIKA